MLWTEARLRSFIQSALRKAFSRYPPKYGAMKKALVGKKQNKTTGRMAYHYRCSKCRKHFPSIDIQIDHKEPVVHVEKGFEDWNTYVERLFCSEDNLQVLCKSCHSKKSEGENRKRRKKQL